MIGEDRRRDLDRRITERYLLTPGDQWAFDNDAIHHERITRISLLLLATEESMALEGIAVEVRDRILYRLLYGEPPVGYGQLDWREARQRVWDRTRNRQVREAWSNGILRLPEDREP